jgi:hypothetical protein
MTQFSLSGKDLPHVADLLAAGAGKAMGSVDDLGMALNQAGLIASSAGLSIEETTGTLAAFASAGLLGVRRRHAMKTMLQKLQAPSKEAARDDVRSRHQHVRRQRQHARHGRRWPASSRTTWPGSPRSSATTPWRRSSDPMLSVPRTSSTRRARRASRTGPKKVNDAGYAAKQAAALQDNLSGDLEKLGGASGLADAFDKLGISSRQAASALAGNQQDFHRILADLEDMDKQAMFTNESWNQLFGTGTRMAMDAVSGKATENADAFRKAAGAAGDYFLIVGNVDAGGWGRQIEAQNALTTATAAATAQTEAASEAQRTLGETLAGFVDPLGEYTGLLDQKKEADRTAAEATAAGTQSSKDSWRDYVTDVKLSFSEYMKGLEDQVTAQANWQTNMLLLAGRVSSGTIAELAKMGPEGAPLVADLVNRSDAELDRFDDITAMRSQQATDAWGKQLTDAAPVLAAIGKTAGAGVVASLVAQLQAGTTTVGQIAAQYGVNLAGGINPVLTALGRSPVTIDKVIARNERYIGGYVGDGGKYEPKGIVHGGEFVLTKEQTAKAGVSNLYNYARSLDGYANGGYVTAADVPKPYSTAPYGAPISTAGDATMGREYNEVKAWVDANAAPAFIGGGVSGGNAANRALGQQIAAGMGLAGQFGAIDFVFSHESGWNNLAQNPTSTAYGIAQFLDSTWATVGGRKTSDPSLQIQYGLKYMNKYGGPNGAANFWKAHHWYANGGVIPEPVEGVGLHSGDRYSFAEHGPEMVVPMSRPTSREVSGGSGGTVVNVAPPSLEGLAITGRLAMDSDGFVTLVDGRIAKAFTAASTRARYNP